MPVVVQFCKCRSATLNQTANTLLNTVCAVYVLYMLTGKESNNVTDFRCFRFSLALLHQPEEWPALLKLNYPFMRQNIVLLEP